MSTGSAGGVSGLYFPAIWIMYRNSGEQQRQNACKRLETRSRNGYDDHNASQQHPCIIGYLQLRFTLFSSGSSMTPLLHHEADAGKVADSHQRADDAALSSTR